MRQRNSSGSVWTEAEESKLRKLKSSGKSLTWQDIADNLGGGRSVESIRQHWKKIGDAAVVVTKKAPAAGNVGIWDKDDK